MTISRKSLKKINMERKNVLLLDFSVREWKEPAVVWPPVLKNRALSLFLQDASSVLHFSYVCIIFSYLKLQYHNEKYKFSKCYFHLKIK